MDSWVVVGLDNGGNKNNGTVLDPSRRFAPTKRRRRRSAAAVRGEEEP